jgi:hypothetical protein
LKHDSSRRSYAVTDLVICQINNSSCCWLSSIFPAIWTLSISALIVFTFSFCFKLTHLVYLIGSLIFTVIIKQKVLFSIIKSFLLCCLSEPYRRSLSHCCLRHHRRLPWHLRPFPYQPQYLLSFTATRRCFILKRVVLWVEIRWGPVSADEASRFFKFSRLVPVCILSIDFTLDALFGVRPILDGLVELFISAFFLQKTILLLEPVTFYFLFL